MAQTTVAMAMAIRLLATPVPPAPAAATPLSDLELARVALPEDLPSGTTLLDVAVSDAGWVAVGISRRVT